MRYIGVDPGLDGGLSLITSTGTPLEYQRMPSVAGIECFFRIAAHSACLEEQVCIFEEHKGGKAGGSNAAAHRSAGRFIGMIQMICMVHNIRLVCVTPQEWKSYFQLINRTAKCAEKPSDKEKRQAAKEASIALCKRHFPGANLLATPKCSNEHDGIAESLLLASYGRLRRL